MHIQKFIVPALLAAAASTSQSCSRDHDVDSDLNRSLPRIDVTEEPLLRAGLVPASPNSVLGKLRSLSVEQESLVLVGERGRKIHMGCGHCQHEDVYLFVSMNRHSDTPSSNLTADTEILLDLMQDVVESVDGARLSLRNPVGWFRPTSPGEIRVWERDGSIERKLGVLLYPTIETAADKFR